MKKTSMKRFMVMAVVVCGTVFQFGSFFNCSRIGASIVDHFFVDVVDLTGLLGL